MHRGQARSHALFASQLTSGGALDAPRKVKATLAAAVADGRRRCCPSPSSGRCRRWTPRSGPTSSSGARRRRRSSRPCTSRAASARVTVRQVIGASPTTACRTRGLAGVRILSAFAIADVGNKMRRRRGRAPAGSAGNFGANVAVSVARCARVHTPLKPPAPSTRRAYGSFMLAMG